MRIYWPWWMFPIWLFLALTKLILWLILLPFRIISESHKERRDVVSIKIRVSDNEKSPTPPKQDGA
jgi:hypothetical protein